ncbi:MAG: hypothetical protein M3495_07045 [Pseudomonadota bacterium]|nr:hypothetical protein [Pseudomonadota bacterium]
MKLTSRVAARDHADVAAGRIVVVEVEERDPLVDADDLDAQLARPLDERNTDPGVIDPGVVESVVQGIRISKALFAERKSTDGPAGCQ